MRRTAADQGGSGAAPNRQTGGIPDAYARRESACAALARVMAEIARRRRCGIDVVAPTSLRGSLDASGQARLR